MVELTVTTAWEHFRHDSIAASGSNRQVFPSQFLDSCRQKTAFPVPVGQTQVLAETPLERRRFLPARRSNQ
jgi:hypothetical protein